MPYVEESCGTWTVHGGAACRIHQLLLIIHYKVQACLHQGSEHFHAQAGWMETVGKHPISFGDWMQGKVDQVSFRIVCNDRSNAVGKVKLGPPMDVLFC